MFFKKNHKREVKKWEWIFLLIIVVLSLCLKIYHARWAKAEITISNQKLTVLVADTNNHRYQGWSDKKDMGKYGGMLFVFPSRGQHTMVMRDMKFPLDIVWLDGRTIVDIAPNLQPEPNKSEDELTPYFSRLPSSLVLELPTGFTSKYGVKIGDAIDFSF